MISYLAPFVAPTLSFSVLVSNIVFLVVLALFAFSKEARQWMINHIHEKPVEHIFFFALVGAIGSLAFSDIVGFVPCDLCWFQRIALYPQAIIAFIAILRKEKQIIYYLTPLSIVGFVISLYQSYVQWGGSSSLLKCTLDGGACGKLYVYAYGYITIPFMALSAFTYLIFISLVYIYGKRNQ